MSEQKAPPTLPTPLTKARLDYGNGYYERKLNDGLEFQDIVTEALYHRGIVIVGYASRRFQAKKGENMLGAEIKKDCLFRETGNLYIETAEKSHPDNLEYVPSGIYRADNSWLFVIGDEKLLWVFSTNYLRRMDKLERYRRKEKPTSRGFLLPLAEADKYCLRRIDLGKEDGQ